MGGLVQPFFLSCGFGFEVGVYERFVLRFGRGLFFSYFFLFWLFVAGAGAGAGAGAMLVSLDELLDLGLYLTAPSSSTCE